MFGVRWRYMPNICKELGTTSKKHYKTSLKIEVADNIIINIFHG